MDQPNSFFGYSCTCVPPWSGINCDQSKPVAANEKDPRSAASLKDKEKELREAYANQPYLHAAPVISSDPNHPDILNNPAVANQNQAVKPDDQWFDTYPHNPQNYEAKPGGVTYQPYNQYGQNNYKYPLNQWGYKPGYQNAQMNSLDYLINANKPYDPLLPFAPPPYPNQQYPGQQLGLTPNRYPNAPNQPYVTPYYNRYPNQGMYGNNIYGQQNGCASNPCMNEGVSELNSSLQITNYNLKESVF